MTSSFRLTPNSAKGGDILELEIEGLSVEDAKVYVGPTCTIEFYEIDAVKRRTGVAKADDLLAKFETTIARIPESSPPRYAFQGFSRTDTFDRKLPAPEKGRKLKDSEGTEWPLKYEPHWIPAHFSLLTPLPSGISGPPSDQPILIRGDKKERERYVYEVAFRILVDGKETFTSRRNPTRVDCSNLVAHNCKVATIMFLKDHKQMVKDRGVGTHYGTDYHAEFDSLYSDASEFREDKKKYDLKGSNCIRYLVEAAALGHAKTLSLNDWKGIKSSMKNGSGITLAEGLEKWGWTGLYISPDSENPRDLDWNPKKWRRNHHAYTLRHAKGKNGRKGKYKGLVVEDLILDYFPTKQYYWWDPDKYKKFPTGVPSAKDLNGKEIKDPDQTTERTTKLRKLEKIPFGFINVVGGYHTAVIVDGLVYEVHWERSPKDASLYDARAFKTWEDGFWGDGIVHVPAMYW